MRMVVGITPLSLQVGAIGNLCVANEIKYTTTFFTVDNLPRPLAPPVLERVNSREIYSVDIPIELEMYQRPSVVFRIEVQPGQYVYQWMVDIAVASRQDVVIMEFLLDLSTFAGRTVNVSFAFATEDGFSAYSQSTKVDILAAVVPVSPSDNVHMIITDSSEKAERAAFCHVTCLDYALGEIANSSNNGSTFINGTNLGNGTNYGNGSNSTYSRNNQPLAEVCLLQYHQ